ncbi:MAG: glycerol-3-phosphate dehydrogenase [Gammaproteobacteria bacterium]|uniref:glycerol-3-phosphate dehydrogenase n=1 Tax=Stutzerimonas xanthomarina TaxID=271420 RepID=UPI000E8C1D0C|nr:glycerol-3-phosphate dehydrogenase [Stutzerimonas xanthomarina]MBU0810159.1 glycerol-3-phosphate dehydrogenase [Gammaproteobacteria bacterium]HAW26249.1 glycerol-3-phosphate dehydrogenase [Pseudomonas sp.]MBK3848253.1 glycerol-3-phosphate dehydrogenase [Stutzerimonas xanthomarina]MBU0852905.1 glycerol-3-phosphate dehydrogenase [Gammaproteobacteria bacterium]MBU1302050.1 glycerol-3-phosphate dehydrogenase [Gammaproteobacteria bacterium]|tara:strand:- start:10026 stop:11570 length:1545 start_codon:yes stop_codon:yes gene_type:complete
MFVLEEDAVSETVSELYDIAVIGGGINGVGIAADAAGRGLSVFLCERDDLASHTSSASSKLIHGGLRYLEHYEFRLVREALAEREVLLAKAPHIVKPMRFVLPHRPHLRPAWMIRAGLFLYDNLGRREKLPASRGLRFGSESPLKAEIKRGFEYSDCWVDDARLVVLNAMAAREKGAHIHTRTQCLSAKRAAGIWHVELQRQDGTRFSLRAKALINAAGPWVAQFIGDKLQQRSPYGIRLIQGSHIIVPKLYEGEQAYIMQNEDRRIVFAIPYLDRYTMIGTTDREYRGDPATVSISEEEIAYLLGVANTHFRKQLEAKDILHSFAGVRPLCDDESDNPSAVTRDYTLSLSAEEKQAPLLSVFGGKLTTYRKLAESAMAQLKPYFPRMGESWTASAPLPGGEGMSTGEALAAELMAEIRGIDRPLAKRWATLYGNRVWRMLGDARSLDALGENFGQHLYAQEVDYLRREEWATQVDDILWRRSKLGLAFTADELTRLQHYLQAHVSRTTDVDAA